MVTSKRERFRVLRAPMQESRTTLADEVERGLGAAPDSQTLPCRFFYDEVGTLLFEEICELDEYYPTRSELQIIDNHADEMVRHASTVIELGSGSARKARILVDAALRGHETVDYLPVDISRKALELCRPLCDEFDRVTVTAIHGEYGPGLDTVREVTQEARSVFWLGGSIGNMDRRMAANFLSSVAGEFNDRDRLFVGIDLRKDQETLHRAYNDRSGVTAAFNLNLLSRINRELGGSFDLDQFRHVAVYDDDIGRIEMYLESTADQTVDLETPPRTFRFAAGQRICTEYSYKYSLREIETLAANASLEIGRRWFDNERRFTIHEFQRPQPERCVESRNAG